MKFSITQGGSILLLEVTMHYVQARQSMRLGLLTFVAWQPLEQQHSFEHTGGASPDPAAVLAVYMLPERHQPLSHCQYLRLPA